MRMPTASDPSPLAGTQLPCLVDGEFVHSARSFENRSPVNGRVLCSVSEADAQLVGRAVQAARRALHGPWGRLTTAERCTLLRKVAERIEQRFADFVSAEIADTGKTLTQASGLDIPRGAANFRAFADLAAVHSTTRCTSPSAWWPSSPPGTCHSCCSRGKWHQRSPAATRW